ncbi:MAG TPA: DUF58 domain-containing protein [Sandaracinaceae bacterium LLY-WYZ-13_1]|nr:DUF58 domain-containing protein [Sandaracinaceae bacterium LLY-WYZ-13_1]
MSDDDEAPERSSKMIPGSRLPLLAAGGLPLAAMDLGTGLGLSAALAYDAVLVVGAAWESRRLDRDAPVVERDVDRRLVVGVENRIGLRLHNPHPRPLKVTIRDDLPEGWEAEPAELTVELPAHARREVSYMVVPPKRGRFSLGRLHLKLEGRARLGARIVSLDATEEARVFPNVLGPRRYELAARLGDLTSQGFRRVRQSGGGGEFEQLREYVAGDPYRDLDWKSTAKRQRPVTRVYEQERSQIVLLAIDAGRMMATRIDRITKLDHAINAALLLAWVALRKGDRVGLIVFGDHVHQFVPPGTGPGQYRKVLDALYAIEAEETFVDFRRLVEFIQVRARKRALLVLFSDLLDEAHAMPLAAHAGILGRRHLPVCVTMHDPVAERLADAPVDGARDAYRRAAAADLLGERERVKAHLRSKGVRLVEAPPGELAVATVNRYLEIKARRAL